MGFLDRLRDAIAAPAPIGRTTGRPTSSNGASSMHARWVGVPAGAISVSVDLTIAAAPTTQDLYFWALQASFATGSTLHGAGHWGLQWISGYPGTTAANWGGYRHGGGELDGSSSALPSSRNNVNTRNYSWLPGSTYRLTIARPGSGRWSGSITNLESGQTTVVRELFCDGHELTHIVMWSEVFAPCDAPSVEASWSSPQVRIGGDSRTEAPTAVTVSYQDVGDGGCSNTYTSVENDPVRVVQRTNRTRKNRHGDTLHLGGSP